jgi:integrase
MTVYTASRSGAVFTAAVHAGANRSFVVLDCGRFYRLAAGAEETNKRQPTVPIPGRLLAHLRRWKRKGIIANYVVEWEGLPVLSVKTGLTKAVRLAGLREKRISPHTFRHTGVTWMLLNGVSTWDAAHYAGMSEDIVRKVYGHHHPDYLHSAAAGISRRR